MTTPLSHEEIRDLLAPYALDAVDDDEASIVELHLRDCPRCRFEVTDYREAASALATGHRPAPAGIWDAIAQDLDGAHDRDGTPPLRLASVLPTRPRPWRGRARLAIATVAAAALAVLGVRVVAQEDRIDQMQTALADRTALAAALAAHADPDAREAELRSANGAVVAHAVLVPDGTGYLWSGGLVHIGSDRTYQLWAIVGTERISVGVLGPEPNVAPFHISGDVVGLALTEEVAGGVVASENQPVASGLVVQA